MNQKHDENDRVGAFVGFTVSGPAFRGMSKRDRDLLHDLGVSHVDADHRFQIIIHEGQIAGYGIPIARGDGTGAFTEISVVKLVKQIRKTREGVTKLVRHAGITTEPSFYLLQG